MGPFGLCGFKFINLRALSLSNFAPTNHKHVRVLLRGAGFLAFAGWLAPTSFGSLGAAALATLSTSVRVIHSVHRRTAHGWADTLPATPARFAIINEHVLWVGNRTDSGP